MVFSLLTGVVKGVVGVVDDLAQGIDETLFDGVPEAKIRKATDLYLKCRSAGMTDAEATDMVRSIAASGTL